MIKQTYTINAPIEKVWEAIVSPKIIDKWGAGPAKMDDKPGSEFTLWGGDIWGKNLEVVKGEKLIQEWFGGDWDKPSKLTIVLKGNSNSTQVDLVHEGVPKDEETDFADGWKTYYFGEIKKLLEK